MTKNDESEDEIYVVTTIDDEDGIEKIVTIKIGMNSFSLVFINKEVFDQSIKFINSAARETGKTLYVHKYKKVELIQKISGAN